MRSFGLGGKLLQLVRIALLAAVLGVPGNLSVLHAQSIEAIEYDDWEETATRASDAVQDNRTTNLALEQLRARLADWRSLFLDTQSVDQSRIETLVAQIDALGPVPVEGATEAPEIAKRRTELTKTLAQLQAPGRAAEEAYRRADGLIGDIDRVIRDRQADAMMQLWPAPVNPTNWPTGLTALTQSAMALLTEIGKGWASPVQRAELRANLPAILAYLVFALVLLYRGRRWVERLAWRLSEAASARGRKVYALALSLGQVLLPMAGVFLLVEALGLTGMVGLVGDVLLNALPEAGFAIFAARWMGVQIFPKGSAPDTLLRLSVERRAEGRFHSAMLGIMLALQIVRQAVINPTSNVEAANAVISFPILAICGLLVFRLGQLLRLHVANDDVPGEATNFRNRLISLIGRAAIVIGVGGPLLAAVGYVAAASAFVYPAAQSLAVIGLLIVLQRLVGDVYALIVRTDDKGRDALVPVLVGFVLTLLSLPVFAITWGARPSDLAEIWARFREGLSLGGARISPTDIVTFALLFGVGYGLTRLFQGALRSSILPKTRMDLGGQNAIVSGVGYIGILLSALFAITSTGIDLSSLAIVAGALSVGIGFGLQNIVSNFVSGIILLIERPVSEGDMIEVGGVIGTVRAISVRSTRIETFDSTDVIVPNADLVSGMVTNWTRFNLTGRITLPIGVAFGSDTRKVEEILREITMAQPMVILNPLPLVHFVGFGADALLFEIRATLRDVNFSLDVRSEINHQIAQRFAAEGIVMPFAQRDIWLRNPEALRPGWFQATVPPDDTVGPLPARRSSKPEPSI